MDENEVELLNEVLRARKHERHQRRETAPEPEAATGPGSPDGGRREGAPMPDEERAAVAAWMRRA